MAFLTLKNEAKIHYEFINKNPNSIPVIFINGSIFNFKQWYPAYLPAFTKLTDNNWSYLLYDYQGTGQSSIKKDKFSVEQLVDELKQLIDHLGFNKVHLFGASKGTMVAQGFAGTYPDLVSSISGYGVLNILSSPEELSELMKGFSARVKAMEYFKDQYDERISEENFFTIMEKVYVPAFFMNEYSNLNDDQKKEVDKIATAMKPMLIDTPILTMPLLFNYFAGEMFNDKPLFEKYINNLKDFKHIKWLNGSIDQTTPLNLVKKLVEKLPNSSLVEFENYGHIDPALNKEKAENVMESYVKFLKTI